MTTGCLTLERYFPCFKTFCFQHFHHYNGLLATGGKRMFQNIIRYHHCAISRMCHSGKKNGHIIIIKYIAGIAMIKPFPDNFRNQVSIIFLVPVNNGFAAGSFKKAVAILFKSF